MVRGKRRALGYRDLDDVRAIDYFCSAIQCRSLFRGERLTQLLAELFRREDANVGSGLLLLTCNFGM
jgi:hypothetical protein